MVLLLISKTIIVIQGYKLLCINLCMSSCTFTGSCYAEVTTELLFCLVSTYPMIPFYSSVYFLLLPLTRLAAAAHPLWCCSLTDVCLPGAVDRLYGTLPLTLKGRYVSARLCSGLKAFVQCQLSQRGNKSLMFYVNKIC